MEQRPSEFSLEKNSQAVQFTLRRYEPSVPEAQLQVRWVVTSVVDDGADITEDVSQRTLTFAGSRFLRSRRSERSRARVGTLPAEARPCAVRDYVLHA